MFGGKIKPSKKRREFGRAFLYRKNNSLLTKNYLNSPKSVWMSHEDAVVRVPKYFKIIASTKDSKLTIIENTKKKFMGCSFILKLPTLIMEKKYFKNFFF